VVVGDEHGRGGSRAQGPDGACTGAASDAQGVAADGSHVGGSGAHGDEREAELMASSMVVV